MKLTEEMDVEDMPMTKVDIVPVNESNETGKTLRPSEENLKSFTSVGLNSINGNVGIITNGSASPDSPSDSNSDLNAIGFEVESYSDLNSSLPPTNCIDNKGDANVPESNDRSKINCGSSSTVKDNSNLDQFVNENSDAEAEITHDSSHLSEEFELRLSDDEDGHEEMSHDQNILSNNGEAVTSTTGDSATKSRYFGQIPKEEVENSESGSGESKEKDKCDLDESLGDEKVGKETKVLCGDSLVEERLSTASEDVGERTEIADSDKLPSSLECPSISKSTVPDQPSLFGKDETLLDKKETPCKKDEILDEKRKEKLCSKEEPTLTQVQETISKDSESDINGDVDDKESSGGLGVNNCKASDSSENEDTNLKQDCKDSSGSSVIDMSKFDQDEESMLLEDKDSKSERFQSDRAQEGICEEIESAGSSSKEPSGLSLEDKLEAELEAELAAEIAAQKQNEEVKDSPSVSDKHVDDCPPANVSCDDTVAVKTSSDDQVMKISSSSSLLTDESKVKVEQEIMKVEEKHKVEQSDIKIKQEIQGIETDDTLPSKIVEESQIKKEPEDTTDEKAQFNDLKGTFETHENFDLKKEKPENDEKLGIVKNDAEIKIHVGMSDKEEIQAEEKELKKSIQPCEEDTSVEPVTSKSDSVAKPGTSNVELENKSDVPNITSDCTPLKTSDGNITPEISEHSDVCASKNTTEDVLQDETLLPLAKASEKDGEHRTVEQNNETESISSVSKDKKCDASQDQELRDREVASSKLEDKEEHLEGRVVSEECLQGSISEERSTEHDKDHANDSEKSPSNPEQPSVSSDADKEIEHKEESSNSALLAASEPNSPASGNDYDFPTADSREESDSSLSGDDCRDMNDDDFDTNCENSTAMDGETNTTSGTDSVGVSGANKVLNSQFTDSVRLSLLSASPTFCDSTAQDIFSADDTDSQEYNMNNISKGYNSDLSSRKRPLSHSEDDSCDSYRSKKFNQLSESNETSDASNSVSDNHHETGHKRPAETSMNSESKKLRGSKDSHSKKFSSFSDFGGASKNSTGKPVDLPFLRSLHRKKLSEMSRSDLEELVLQKVCEAITERSTVGELRVRCLTLERRQEKENEKFNKLRKQMTELTLVMKKYMEQQRLNKPAPPIKVTRSVGLQVFPCQGSQCYKAPIIKYVQPPTAAVNATPTKPDTPPDPSSQKTPMKTQKSPSHSPRPVGSIIISSDPPALVPTGIQNAVKVPTPTRPTVPTPTRPAVTPQRVAVPPLYQIPGARPRLNIPTSVPSLSAQLVPIQPKQSTTNRPQTPQSTTTASLAANDVEVIDIIDKGDQNKRTAEVQISPLLQQQQHQQKQALNAAAQSLAGNSGMTVQLIPSQVTQALSTSGYPQLIVPPQNMQSRMILTSSPQGTAVRSMKLLVKANNGNVIFPLQTNGTTVPNSVVQQIFTNANTNNRTTTVATVRPLQNTQVHPAPLPYVPSTQANNPAWKQVPPKPNLKIQHQNNGIVLSWNMALGPVYAEIESYQLYAYQESSAPPSASLWKKVGDVKALPLPMACTLTQFVEGHRYHFTVRAVDKHGRVGPFSQQGSIRLGN